MGKHLTENEVEELLYLAESCRDEARMNQIEAVGQPSDAKAITLAVAEVNVRRSNTIRKALLALGYTAVGPEWKIEGNRVVPVKAL